MRDMTTLYLVRHGRTILNEQRRAQGSSDSPLTAEGVVGAKACRDYLAEVGLTKAYSSPQGRAVETSQILLQAHPELELVKLSGLREYDYGIYDGGPDPEMLAALPPERQIPEVLTGIAPGAPGGISAKDYLTQIDAALARILNDAHAADKILVVSHGMTLMVMLGRWVGLEIFGYGPFSNCGVTTIEVDDAGTPCILQWGADPGNQGVTFEVRDFSQALKGIVPLPIDFSAPEGL